ncbi:hypothetical protein [Candidatus Marinarcus aquaticus]|uniref:Uncharacterized protein n=1 Tax=Candidatus Marinarcus aquaticus TaxID=2044504 RepID=A0A4V1LNW5_9BACT|nr:hypothetical protein [Candidatus Marinarcus aquaticus]RXJ56482.1 hypothetical protein CRV04_08705 [Candidatus Marinarcus aquaticus]
MDSIIYELRANNVTEEHIELIMSKIKNRLSEENLDAELQKLGYDKIFTVDYDDYYDDDIDDFESMHKSSYRDFEE